MCTDCLAGKYSPAVGTSASIWCMSITHERSMRDELYHACSCENPPTVFL